MPIADWQDAIREAYTAAPNGQVILSTLELRHASLVAPVRLVRSPGDFIEHDDESGLDIYGHMLTLESTAPVNPGATVLFQAVMFRFKLPSQTDARISGFEIAIDNATKYVSKSLDTAVTVRDPMTIIYREYISEDLSAPSMVVKNLTVKKIRSTVNQVTAIAEFADLVNKKFPSILYTPDEFRGLVA